MCISGKTRKFREDFTGGGLLINVYFGGPISGISEKPPFRRVSRLDEKSAKKHFSANGINSIKSYKLL